MFTKQIWNIDVKKYHKMEVNKFLYFCTGQFQFDAIYSRTLDFVSWSVYWELTSLFTFRNGQLWSLARLIWHLSVLHGHSFFSSPPQRPITSDFEGFLSQMLSITFVYILILEKEPVFPAMKALLSLGYRGGGARLNDVRCILMVSAKIGECEIRWRHGI